MMQAVISGMSGGPVSGNGPGGPEGPDGPGGAPWE